MSTARFLYTKVDNIIFFTLIRIDLIIMLFNKILEVLSKNVRFEKKILFD